jgi:outer membrane protein assembly factor BamB/3-methyladenine DNA glycosylase AlkC
MIEENLTEEPSLPDTIASLHVSLLTAQNMIREIWNFKAGNKINSLCSAKMGLIVGSEDGNIYLLNEEGKEEWRYETEGWVNAVFYGDVDQDDVPEIVACSEDRHVYVLSESGKLKWSYEGTAALRALSCGDLDSDGELEIVAGALGGSIYVLSPYGELKWDLNISHDIHVANDVCSLCVADVTGDEKSEIVAGAFDTDVHVLDGKGEYIWRYDTGHWVLSLDVGDIDGDGHNEVIVGSEDRHVYVLDYQGRVKWRFRVQDRVMKVLVADLNQDGQEEVIAASEDHGVYVLSQLGDLIWRHDTGHMVRSASFLGEAENGSMIAVGLDDGQVQVLQVESIQKNLTDVIDAYASFQDRPDLEAELTEEDKELLRWVLSRGLEQRGEAQPTFEAAQEAYRQGEFSQALSAYLQLAWRRIALKWSYQTENWVRSVYACDVDGDGKNEVVVGSEDKCVYLLDWGGNLKWKYQARDRIFQIYAADIDNDGWVEIIAGSEDKNIYVLDCNGLLKARYEMPDFVRSIYACDVDGDNATEMIIGCFDNHVYVLDSQGREKWRYRTNDKVRTVYAEDIDGDGCVEVMAGSGDRNLYVFDGQGTLKWQYQTNHWVRSICTSDIDRDGEMEVLLGSDDRYMYALDNRGNPLWKYRTGNWVASLYCLDIDSDNSPETLIGSYDRYIYVLDEQGYLKWKYDIGDRIKSIYALDLDGDGNIEILVGSDDGKVYAYSILDQRDIDRRLEECWASIVNQSASEEGAIQALLKDDEYLRGYALHKLPDLTQASAMLRSALEEMRQDGSTYLQCQFAQSLPKIFPKAPEQSRELAHALGASGQQEVCLALVNGLSRMADAFPEDAFDLLSLLAAVEDVWTRREVARRLRELSRSHPRHALPLLFRLACDEEEWVQHETALSLANYLDEVADAKLTLETIDTLLKEGCQVAVLDYVSVFSKQRFVQGPFSLFHNLLRPRLIEDLIATKHVLRESLDQQDVLGPNTMQVLRNLHRVVEIARELGQADNLQAKVQYAIQAAAAVEATNQGVHSLGEEGRVFLHVLSRWRNVLSTTLSSLQQASDLRVSTATKRLPYAPKVTFVFTLENRGGGLARNISAKLKPSDDYVTTKEAEKVPVLYSDGHCQLEFVVAPLARDRLRVELEIQYDDLVAERRERSFADRIEFFELLTGKFVGLEPNPYIVGRPLRATDTALFMGREDVFEYVRTNLRGKYRDNIIVLHGQRRTGKTSILYQIGRILGDEYVPVFIDMQSILDVGTAAFLFTIAKAVYNALESRAFEMPAPQFSDFVGQPGIVFREEFLTQALKMIGERTLILMFDEFELLDEFVQQGKLDQGIFSYLRNLMQHSDRLDFFFAGTHKLEEMSGDYWSILFNMALYKKVSFLNPEDARQLISRPVSKHFEYDELAIDKIIWATAGHPHFTQLLCHHLVTFRNRKELTYITVGDVNEVIDAVIETGGIHINYIWAQSSNDEKLFMAALSETLRQHGRAAISDLRATLDKYAVRINFAEVIENLIARDLLIEEKADTYAFRIGLVGRWVERNKSIHQVLREVQG